MKYILALLFLLIPGLPLSADNGVHTDSLYAASSSRCKPPYRSKKRIKIMIDPGHGGEDYGTYSLTKPRLHEKDFVLRTSSCLRRYLKRMGYDVEMTRSKDVFIPLQKRVDLAKKAGAQLFISVHYNSAPNVKANGVEVFYYNSTKDKDRSTQSKKLAERVLKQITSHVPMKSRGVKHGNFLVIRNADIPAILIEGGFLTNDGDLAKLKDPKHLNRTASGIAKGIKEYIEGKG